MRARQGLSDDACRRKKQEAEKLVKRPNSRLILMFAALGVLTGTLSYLTYQYSLNQNFFRLSFLGLVGAEAPILPGVIFGVLVGGSIYRFGLKDRFLLLLTVLLVTVTRTLAHDIAVSAHSSITQSGTSEVRPLADTISFGIGGLVGGFGTCLAVAIGSPRFRRFDWWLFTLFVAVLSASTVVVYELLLRAYALIGLFVV
jgi:hypothetical protein